MGITMQLRKKGRIRRVSITFKISLKGRFMLTSKGCTNEVQPPGIRLTVISLARKVSSTSGVLRAAKRSRTRSDG